MKFGFNRHLGIIALFVSVLAVGILSNQAVAQSDKKTTNVKPPEPERVLLETKDGVEMRAEWYAASGGKETVPVILVHDWDSDRSALLPLAAAMQKQFKLAVIVPDLRGHGESMTVKSSDEEMDRKRFKKAALASMGEDVETCRRFLQSKNDAGELNLNLLTVVCFGKMAIPTIEWCISDWSWPPLQGVQQGQNVKLLVMVSPRRRFKSMNMSKSLKHPLFAAKSDTLPLLMFWGDDHQATSKEGETIMQALKKSRDEKETLADQEERWEKQSVFNVSYNSDGDWDTLLQKHGRDMLKAIGMTIEKKILANADSFDWQKRSLE